MNKGKILLFSIMISSVSLQAQTKIDSILIYSDFVERGYTTAGASTHFKELGETESSLIKVGVQDLNRIKCILNNANCKKHTQTKLGIGMLFSKLITEKDSINVLISKKLIVDLIYYRNYWIEDNEDQVWLEEFINRVKEGY